MSTTGQSILEQQRLRRPIAPHLSIYQPQLTWYLSALNRITGVTVAGLAYVFGIGYVASPLLGLDLSSVSIAESFGSLPAGAKVAIKGVLALPFTFHSINGVRHLIWDTGRMLTNQAVIRSGYGVIGLSILSAAYLAA